MPAATYEELLTASSPSRIETEAEYDAVRERLGALLRSRRPNRAEEKFLNLLTVLIEDYDRRHSMPPSHSTPAERLRFLVEQTGRSPADLLPVFGQRSHVNEALNGNRAIGAGQARKLGKLFAVHPGLFIA